ncbi:MAG: hypothetical protein CVT92_01010 [Bacteroidetes bacterium HGW-Bacteroidetes-1]|jgi:hypothetical protein|nr:MAG: hypothetical protein CVT92_01010 [Bacteroidetes bacterium HGW-Bacteroidetes-1]
MKKFQLFALMMLLLISGFVSAQDMILKKDDEIIKCKIKEIGLEEIKYILPDHPSDLLFSIDKDRVTKIILENGMEMEFQKAMTDPANYKDNKKNALKIEFMSPITGNTTFGYERSLKPGRSMEGALGIIGLGLDQNDNNAGGVFVKFGYKFIKDPDFYLRGMRYSHILKGSYIKPELAFGVFGRDYYDWRYESSYYDQYGNWIYVEPAKKRQSIVSGTIQLVLGKQWVFDNVFLVDMYGGIGYGFSAGGDDYEIGYHYGYTIAPSEFPVSFSAGLKIGYLFK